MLDKNLPESTPKLAFHAHRSQLFNELHTRPFPVIATPARISQLSMLYAKDDQQSETIRHQEYAHICRLCERYSVSPPTIEANCYYQDFGGFEFRWERHTEFSTYTFIHHLEANTFERTGLSLLPNEWLAGIPGEVISGVHIEVEEPPESIEIDSLRNFFEGHRLLSSFVSGRQAQIWTSYRIHSDDMGRFLIFNHHLNPCQTGRLVRRLLEMETYRMMALLSFPIAKQIAPDIRKMNLDLADIIQQITNIKSLEDERYLLGQLTNLSAHVAQIISDNNYRFSATEAYYNLTQSRLAELNEEEVCGLQTLDEFLSRRLTPAYLTCDAVGKDLDELSQRIDRASELLRTRMNLTIESQNQNLLQSMNRRGKLQLQMQQAVEGLSVAAISYYLVGLVNYTAESAKAIGLIQDSYLVTGLSVPFIVGFVMFGLSRMKRKLFQKNKQLKERELGKD